mgnify:CR=1 FL=1
MKKDSRVDPAFWSGKRVFVTGHTGFKGGWLSAWLVDLGARVKGYALAPDTDPNLFSLLNLERDLEHVEADLRDSGRLAAELSAFKPEVVLHLGAQALVRRSYLTPVDTFSSNVMGTVHVLDAVRACPSVQAVVNVTTDKCYENREWVWGYREEEALGGHDPYSASKACSEIVTSAYRRSFLAERGLGLATARAGNVLGGGDWCLDRLVPDAVRAWSEGRVVEVRNPASTRPWQHVLEPLSGYLMLAERLSEDPGRWSEAWNLGPRAADVLPVGTVMEALAEAWPDCPGWKDVSEGDLGPHEAGLLKLDISKVTTRLGWRPRSDVKKCLQWTVDWYRAHSEGADSRTLRELTLTQIRQREAGG